MPRRGVGESYGSRVRWEWSDTDGVPGRPDADGAVTGGAVTGGAVTGGAVAGGADADALLLTPAHRFPIEVPLAAHRRTSSVRWAHETGGLVIEDDYDGEFRYDRRPVGALQALVPEQVVYAGTASKSLAPGLRLAWLVLPAALVEEAGEDKRLADGHTSTFGQLTLAEFITSGDYDRHVRRCRPAYRRRRDRPAAALYREAPQVRVTGVTAGLHALLGLPSDADEDAVVARAAEHGSPSKDSGAITPATTHSGHDRGPALVVG